MTGPCGSPSCENARDTMSPFCSTCLAGTPEGDAQVARSVALGGIGGAMHRTQSAGLRNDLCDCGMGHERAMCRVSQLGQAVADELVPDVKPEPIDWDMASDGQANDVPFQIDGREQAIRDVRTTCDRRRAETVDHPAHYGGGDDPFEAIKVMEAWAEAWIREGASPADVINLTQLLKYVRRHRQKGKTVEDLKKARWYLDRVIESVSP